MNIKDEAIYLLEQLYYTHIEPYDPSDEAIYERGELLVRIEQFLSRHGDNEEVPAAAHDAGDTL